MQNFLPQRGQLKALGCPRVVLIRGIGVVRLAQSWQFKVYITSLPKIDKLTWNTCHAVSVHIRVNTGHSSQPRHHHRLTPSSLTIMNLSPVLPHSGSPAFNGPPGTNSSDSRSLLSPSPPEAPYPSLRPSDSLFHFAPCMDLLLHENTISPVYQRPRSTLQPSDLYVDAWVGKPSSTASEYGDFDLLGAVVSFL